MKKFMTLMLALSFLSTTAVVAFGQDAPKKDDTAKKSKKKKKGTDSPATPASTSPATH
jgi:hypothetical protein